MTRQDKNQTTKNPLVILIAGPAGTGKSTLASIFVDLLNERLVRSQGTSGKSKRHEDTNDSTRLKSVTFLEGDELHSSEVSLRYLILIIYWIASSCNIEPQKTKGYN